MKTALITGSALRVGRDISLHLAKKGYNIILHCNKSFSDAIMLEDEIKEFGVECHIIQKDLNIIESPQEMLDEAYTIYKRIDLLVNNAAVYNPDTFSNFDEEQFFKQIRINFMSPCRLMNIYAKKQTSGLVINLLDSKVTSPDRNFFSYTISKVALEHATILAAKEFRNTIRVNGIAPTAVLPPKINEQEPNPNKLFSFTGTKVLLSIIDEYIDTDQNGVIRCV